MGPPVQTLWKYRIAGNFRGRKLSRILRFDSHPQKFSPRNFGHAHAAPTYSSNPWKFSPWNYHFLWIRKSFLPRKFTAIRYLDPLWNIWHPIHLFRLKLDSHPLTLLNLTLNLVARGPNTSKYLELGKQLKGVQIFYDRPLSTFMPLGRGMNDEFQH